MNKLLFFLLLLLPGFIQAQEKSVETSMQEYARSLESELKILKTAESQGDKKSLANINGRIGDIYLSIAKLPTEGVQNYGIVTTDKKENLNKAIQYSNKSIDLSEEVGDIVQLKSAYKDLYAAQKMMAT